MLTRSRAAARSAVARDPSENLVRRSRPTTTVFWHFRAVGSTADIHATPSGLKSGPPTGKLESELPPRTTASRRPHPALRQDPGLDASEGWSSGIGLKVPSDNTNTSDGARRRRTRPSLRMSLAWKRKDVQKRGHDGPLGLIAERSCLAAMPNPTTTCGICGSAAIVTGTDGTIRQRASELPSPIIIVTIECPKCGTRQQPEKPSDCEIDRSTGKQSSKAGLHPYGASRRRIGNGNI